MALSSFENESASAGRRLRQSIPKILSDWENRLRQEILAAEHQQSVVLIKHIPGFLERLADELSVGRSQGTLMGSTSRRIGKEEAQEQGIERANVSQYDLHGVILEYHILREVIVSTLEAQELLLPVERDIILNSIDRSVNDTASQFVKAVQSFHEIFLLGLVHDLRGPASNVAMASELIMRDKRADVEGIKTLASLIRENVSRIDRMTTDLLDASKAQAGGALSLMQLSEFDLVRNLKDIVKNMKADRVKVQVPHHNVLVTWSPIALQRIIENLVGNALKFGQAGSSVEVRVEDNGPEITLAVHNMGSPIPIENRSTLFEKFSRGPEQHTKQGWGIGLVLVKGLVDAHHGSIEIESEEVCGTTFLVRLPRQVPVEIIPKIIS